MKMGDDLVHEVVHIPFVDARCPPHPRRASDDRPY